MYMFSSDGEGVDMTSRNIIASLQEQLLLVMKEVKLKEQELSQCQQALEKMSRRFSVIIHQQVWDSLGAGVVRVCRDPFISQGVLYKEHQESEAVWKREREEMKREKEELMTTQRQQEVNLQELKVHMVMYYTKVSPCYYPLIAGAPGCSGQWS